MVIVRTKHVPFPSTACRDAKGALREDCVRHLGSSAFAGPPAQEHRLPPRKGAKFIGSMIPPDAGSSQVLTWVSTAHRGSHQNCPQKTYYVPVGMRVPSVFQQHRTTGMDARRPLRIDSDCWRPALHGRGSVKPDTRGQVIALLRGRVSVQIHHLACRSSDSLAVPR